MKLIVQVLDASDLMPKDGQGSSNPFVQVEFDQQIHRTQTKVKALNPVWNETLVFDTTNPQTLVDQTVEVSVYHEKVQSCTQKTFLGRVRISGSSVPSKESESQIQRCPLDKRGIFSNIRGEIALKIYTDSDSIVSPPKSTVAEEVIKQEPIMKEERKENQKRKEDETHIVHSNGTAAAPPPAVPHYPQVAPKPVPPSTEIEFHVMKQTIEKEKTVVGEDKSVRFGRTEFVNVMHMHMPKPSEFGLVETSPLLAGKLGYRLDKISSTYDLVEQMHFLYIKVVKAKDLPSMDITGSLDPYAEVKLGNYKCVTKHFDKNQNPVWNQVFAFPKERLQSNVVEVLIKDKDLLKDDFVGRVQFEMSDIPLRVPPDSPLAPQWYKLENKKGEKVKGEIMLAIWFGTQADECLSVALHSDAHAINPNSLSNIRSQVYFSPKLFYLRIHVIEAQDLVSSDKIPAINPTVLLQVGNDIKRTRSSQTLSMNPTWNEEHIFVVSEPLNEFPIFITVEDKNSRNEPNKIEVLGRLILPVSIAVTREDHRKVVEARWFNLDHPDPEKMKDRKFSSKIHLRVFLDSGYHVLDESTHYSSDLQPSSKHLRKPRIGVLELGILSARNLLPMKTRNDRTTTDSYCVAKYGSKWIRTRTLIDSLDPHWNEQYTWDVYDPCTVITVGVFDNHQIFGNNNSNPDQRIGKVRIRLSTLETDRIYTHYYPLLVLQPGGLKKTGELHLAIRFTSTAWINMIALYSKPLLPQMHYINPINVTQLNNLRQHAIKMVAASLTRAEPPLRRETVEYLLDYDVNMFSIRRSKANFYRITNLLSGLIALGRWFDDVRYWKSSATTVLVHVLFLILVSYPELILPTIFLYLFLIGLWNYRFRPRNPAHMDTRLSHAERAHPEELDEEFDTFPSSKPQEIVRIRYDRLRGLAARVQTVVGDMATQGERTHALLSWRDPRATAIFVTFSLALAVILYVTPPQMLAILTGLYVLRHPRLRNNMPSAPFNFYKRLPAKSDMLL